VAQDLKRVGVLLGDDLERGVALDAKAGIDQLAVDLAGQGRLGQSGANRGGHVGHGNGVLERTLAAVGERDLDHRDNSGCRKRKKRHEGACDGVPRLGISVGSG
jgi:hypothetical protein